MNEAQRKRALLTLFSVILLDLIGFALLVPTIPLLAKTYHASGTILGVIVSSYTAMQFLFAPLWGRLSDKIGRKRVLIISIVGAGFSMILLGFATNLWMIFLSRLLGGMFAANIGVASAYITDITPNRDRTKAMGLIGVAFGVGFLLGPTLGGMLVGFGQHVPIFVTSALNFINAIYAYAVLQEDRHGLHGVKRESLPLKEVLTNSLLLKICIINFVFTFSLTQLETTFAFYMKSIFSSPDSQIYFIFSFMALLMIFVQGGLIRRLSPRYSDMTLLMVGAGILSLGFLLLPQMHYIPILLLPLAAASIGRGVAQPSLTSMASKVMDTGIGTVMGVFTASTNLARFVGQLSAGAFFDLRPSLPFYVAGVLMLVIFIGGKKLLRHLTQSAVQN